MRPRLRRLLLGRREVGDRTRRAIREVDALLSHPTPFTGDEKARKHRNNAAASLVEDDTFAYVVVRLRKPSMGAQGRIEVCGHVLPAWWPAFRETFERLISAGSEFYPDDE